MPRLVALAFVGALVVAAGSHQVAAQESAGSGHEGRRPITFSFDDHPAIELWGVVRLEANARFDAEVRDLEGQSDEEAREWSGRRLGVRGTVLKRVEFELSRELGDASRPWRDVYVNLQVRSWLEVRGGRFKVPFGEERLRGLDRQEFVYRSRASAILAPGRDRGIVVHGRLRNQTAAWEAGVFAGRSEQWTGRRLDADTDARLRAGRLVLRPFGSSQRGALLRSWRVGAAATSGRRTSGLWEVEGETLGGAATSTMPVFVSGSERRLGLESTWSPRPFRFGTEWMRLDAERRGQGLDGSDLTGLRLEGWYGTAMWRVLGRGSRRAWDSRWRRALEVGGRVEWFRLGLGPRPTAPAVDEDLPLPAHRLVTLGVNWVGRRWVRVQGNAIWERISNGAPPLEREERRLGVVLRLQLTL